MTKTRDLADLGGGFIQAGTGAVQRTVESKLQDMVSVKDFGAVGNGVADDTVAIQTAVASGARTVFFPNGDYKISSTIRQATNGYGLRLVGENKHHANLVAAAGLTGGAPMIWLGNSNGHGNYRAQVGYLNFVGNNNCVGLRYHEAGTSEIISCQFTDCTVGIDCPGVIGSQIQRCDMFNCTVGVNMTRPITGTPASVDDIAVTASPLSLSNNINKVSDCWISGGSCGIHVEGGLTHIQGCTFQAVGNSTTRSVIELVYANEAAEYGGGPIVSNCWSESGTYLAFVQLTGTRKVVIRENFLSLDGSAQVGIYADSGSVGTVIQNNSFLGRGTAALTGGRTQNAAVYVDSVQTTLMNNHYASFGTFTYAQLIKLNWASTSSNIVIENGQNASNGFGVYFGLTQFGVGNIGLIGPNPLVSGPFNNYLNGHQLTDCLHDKIYFNTGVGPLFFVKAGVPAPGDATFIGDLCLDRTNANLYIHVGSGSWKLLTRAA